MYDDVIQNKVVYTLSEFILRWTFVDLTEYMHTGLEVERFRN